MLQLDHIEAPFLRDMFLPMYPSIVVAGAYKGDTVAFLLEHHKDLSPNILACEPQAWAVLELSERFKNAKKVIVTPIALGAVSEPETCTLYNHGTDACTIIDDGTSLLTANLGILIPAVPTLKQLGFGFIDLFHMNMEGYEYQLIPWLLNSPDIYIKRFLIQFHSSADRFKDEYEQVILKLQGCGYKWSIPIGKGWEYWAR